MTTLLLAFLLSAEGPIVAGVADGGAATGAFTAPAAPLSANILTLQRALTLCDEHQPLLAQAAANTRAAGARVDEAIGQWLPQVNGAASLIYNQTLANAGSGGGSIIGGGSSAGISSVISNGSSAHTTFGVTANQLIYDFNQTLDRIKAAKAAVRQYEQAENEQLVVSHLAVRSGYYNARALKALLDVAKETLDNEQKHLELTTKQIAVGVQPGIALATEKATFANDVYQAINAKGAYSTGKAQLNQAIGIEGPIDYDVLPLDAPPVAEETWSTDQLMEQALKVRPAYLSVLRQIDFQELTVSSYKSNLLPNILGQAGLLATATRPSDIGTNLFLQASVTWPLFNWTNINDIKEQQAGLALLFGQADQLRQQIRTDLETARVQVETYLSSVKAAEETVVNTHDQLSLAEGRYKIGIGNVIELGDAQVAYTAAQSQRIQAQFNLNNARSTLLAKLGQL
jgi:outer membrane protein